MQAHSLSLHILSTLGVRSKVKPFFSESSPVAYQIKENRAWSTMQAHILPLHAPIGPLVQNVKTCFFK